MRMKIWYIGLIVFGMLVVQSASTLGKEAFTGLLPKNWSSLYERIIDSRGIF